MTLLPRARPSVAGSGHREPWLLIFNCQADGLANSLSLLDPGIEVTHFDPERFASHGSGVMSCLDSYERILVTPYMEHLFKLDFGDRDNVWRVPEFVFFGYHPDLCYVSVTDGLFKGPLGSFHSALAYAAFRHGVGEVAAAELFREEVFEALGYLAAWDEARETMLGSYRHHGFMLEEAFARWSAAGPFMHTPNHPGIRCLHDLAKVILLRAGRQLASTGIIPHDNLAHGPIFPVYPEIGARLGVVGHYMFKAGGGYRLMGLDEYLNACFRVFQAHPAVKPSVAGFKEKIERAIDITARFC